MNAMPSAAAAAAILLLLVLIVVNLPGQTTCQRTSYLYYSSEGQVGGRPGLYVSGTGDEV